MLVAAVLARQTPRSQQSDTLLAPAFWSLPKPSRIIFAISGRRRLMKSLYSIDHGQRFGLDVRLSGLSSEETGAIHGGLAIPATRGLGRGILGLGFSPSVVLGE